MTIPQGASKAHFDRNRFWKHHLVSTMSCKGQREDQAAATNAVVESLRTQQATQETRDWSLGAPARVGPVAAPPGPAGYLHGYMIYPSVPLREWFSLKAIFFFPFSGINETLNFCTKRKGKKKTSSYAFFFNGISPKCKKKEEIIYHNILVFSVKYRQI
jgi:hypothetical protein